MPEFIAVKCCSDPCSLFQVIQLPKKKVFVCRVCQTKQSIKTIFAQSFKASDIRGIVQQYNLERGQRKETQNQKTPYVPAVTSEEGEEEPHTTTSSSEKWARFLKVLPEASGQTRAHSVLFQPQNENEKESEEDDGVYVTVLPDTKKTKRAADAGSARKRQTTEKRNRSAQEEAAPLSSKVSLQQVIHSEKPKPQPKPSPAVEAPTSKWAKFLGKNEEDTEDDSGLLCFTVSSEKLEEVSEEYL